MESYAVAEKGPRIHWDKRRPTVALLNANPYSLGIANLGAQAIMVELIAAGYNIELGFADTTSAERPFMANFATPKECMMIAVSVPFEDTYHHVPCMLRQCGLASFAQKRDETDPIVVAGGMALINPMPLAQFFDVMVIGEGRGLINSIAQLIKEGREKKIAKRDTLVRIAHLGHCFVPSLYRFVDDDMGNVVDMTVDDGAPKEIYANRPLDLLEHPLTTVWTSSRACYDEDDYFSIMTSLGCHRKCPYCVVGNTQGAHDGRALNTSRDQILELSEERRREHGTNLIKLFFASSFSQSGSLDPLELQDVLEALLSAGFKSRVGSLNISQADPVLFDLLKALGQRKATFAPESGATLRASIGKAYSKDDRLIEMAAEAGKRGLGLDLYTMIGLPNERPEHLDELAQLIGRVRAVLPQSVPLEVAINPVFVKAQTPFERYATVRPDEARRRLAFVRGRVPATRAPIKWVSVAHSPLCYYQPILSMGGPELGPVLDEMSQHYDPSEAQWRAAIRRHVGSDERYFAPRQPGVGLPWQHVVFSPHEQLSRRLARHLEAANTVSPYQEPEPVLVPG